ncbi:MAG: type II toxin-antitoxin system Phd/YefM family antitoxin, partial [Elusimicrobia bacterium]|nr:type II toxin-antitoxin system Phd/YefM family antitoxin [Elusimicrobiota bacterium]
MNKIIPISDLQTSAKKYVEQVRETDEPVIVTAGKSQRGSGQLRKLRGPAGHPGAHAEYRSTA